MAKPGAPGPHRLLNVTIGKLECFSDAWPPYAILSHTWGEEEVSLQSWQDRTSIGSEGDRKVVKTCLRAIHDGYEYVWCDTCCVDKTNPTELQEAINSMFRWYRDAAVCYVLLSDLTVDNSRLHSKNGEKGLRNDIRETHTLTVSEQQNFMMSRYFTRGWTLQEILAGADVHFFSSNWTPLGDLRHLFDPIHRATNIDKELLLGRKHLKDFTVPQKMSWAANRQTKRREDRAYSLLGIMGVSLDVRYGDGEREFVRLQKEILKQSGGIQVLAWTSPTGSPRNRLLATSPEDFRLCSNICSDPSASDSAEMWETNVGLKGTFSVLDCSREEGEDNGWYLIPLDCYEQHAPESVLALRARRVRSRTGTVTPAIKYEEPSLAMAASGPGLSTISSDQYARRMPMKLTILWESQNSSPLAQERNRSNSGERSATLRAAPVAGEYPDSERRIQPAPPIWRGRLNSRPSDSRSTAAHSQSLHGRSLRPLQQRESNSLNALTSHSTDDWVRDFKAFVKVSDWFEGLGIPLSIRLLLRWNSARDQVLFRRTPGSRNCLLPGQGPVEYFSETPQSQDASVGHRPEGQPYDELLDENVGSIEAKSDPKIQPGHAHRPYSGLYGAISDGDSDMSCVPEPMRLTSSTLEALQRKTAECTIPHALKGAFFAHFINVRRAHTAAKEQQSFSCTFCSSQFTRGDQLDRHVRMLHSNQNTQH